MLPRKRKTTIETRFFYCGIIGILNSYKCQLFCTGGEGSYPDRPLVGDGLNRWIAWRLGMDPEILGSILGHVWKGKSVLERHGRISDPELTQAIDMGEGLQSYLCHFHCSFPFL